MQKHGEILADAAEALGGKLLGRGADDHPVALLDRQAEQGIAYRPADLVHFHDRIIPSVSSAEFSDGQMSAELWVEVLAIVAASAVLAGCALPFYWQAIGGQLELLRKRTPIETLLADPALDPSLKSALGAVAEIRRFAVAELELPDNDSYTTYVDLERPYVVWNVVAADEFSVDPKRWCFPFAGCVAYRGFFDRADAEQFQQQLVARGLRHLQRRRRARIRRSATSRTPC